MSSAIIGLLAETSIHAGSGQAAGGIDLPVAREKTTDYPVILGSSLKGALRDRAEQVWGIGNHRVREVFGDPEKAGDVSVSDARLLLLPVRSLNGHFRWVTCPYLLERYRRDRELAGMSGELLTLPEIGSAQALACSSGTLFLEELTFEAAEADLVPVVREIAPLILHAPVRERLLNGLAIVRDDDFAYFARFGLPVNARNVLDDDTKTSKNLWYEETVPPDSLFYALLMARPGRVGALRELAAVFDKRPYLQVGGNETIGQGWCAVSWLESGGEV